MSFDKEKARRAAEKNLSQGKIQAAIKDYCQIVEHDQKDFNTLNMLGDLYVRVEAQEEAIACFNRIADHYNSQGFAHKAIAMYKKILRLMPGSVDIAARLAPLYQMLGLVSEARSFYLLVAESHQKNGNQIKALEIWSRIADLDPNDTTTRLKLAESYLRENQRDLAAESYAEAGNRLLAKKQTEQAAEVFAKALELRPVDLTALNGATSASIALGFPDEAAERLEKAFELYPESNEILSLLAHSYVEAENVAAAELAVSRLIEREPSSYKRHLDVVRLYLKENNLTDAARVLGLCGEILISNNLEEELLQWTNEVLARDPEQMTALRLLTRVRAWQRNEDELKNALERLAEAAQLNHLEDDERNALAELNTLFPEDERYSSRLRELGGSVETKSESAPEQNNANGYVPTFESFNNFNDEGEQSTAVHNSEFESNSAQPWEAASNGYSANPFAADKNQDEFESAAPSNAFEFAGTVEAVEYSGANNSNFDFDANEQGWNIVNNENAGSTAVPKSEFQPPRPLAQLEQELESVDFYIAQNYHELALESLGLLENQFGRQAIIEQRRTQIAQAQNAAPIVETQKTAAPPQQIELEKSTDSVYATAGFEELFAELGGEDIEVAALPTTQTADYETHYNLGLAYKEMGLFDDAVEEFQNAVKKVKTGDGTPRYLQCCHLIGHCFMEKAMPNLAVMWYQRGLDAPGHTEDEYQALRYELGTAYEAEGKSEKAFELFSGIYAVNVAYRNVGDKLKTLQPAH